MYCLYYQAHVNEKDCWYLVAVLRSFEHLVFDRTFDKKKSIFEFFVPHDLEYYFLEVMSYFEREHIVTYLEKLPNRLFDLDAIV
jgi:hypothetical protein